MAVLDGYAILDGAGLDRPVLLASWTRHAISEITVHDLVTGERRPAELPGTGHAGGASRLGTTGGISERPEGGHEAWFGYTDNTTPLDRLSLRRAHRGGHRVGRGARRRRPSPRSPPGR